MHNEIRNYIAVRKSKPIIHLRDGIHVLHAGTDYEAEITVSHLVSLLERHDEMARALMEIGNGNWTDKEWVRSFAVSNVDGDKNA